jgi:toxin ParE1/3/4
MKVHWTNTALDQLKSIHDYIACNSPYYAKRMVDRITGRSIQIAQFPLSGQKVPDYSFQHLSSVFKEQTQCLRGSEAAFFRTD